VKKDKVFVFTYSDDTLSLTKDVANELLYRLKDKVVVMGRKRGGDVRCSIRAPKNVNVKVALEKALVGVQGYGGGHDQAVGCSVKEDDFDRFIENLKSALK
jgi:single-stranded DNA-specific DHH superfamily exonuclease